MESNLVCNHTSDLQNCTTAKRESDFFLSRVWLHTELDDKKACYQLIKTMTKFEKESRYQLYVFIKTKNNTAECETTAPAHDAFFSLIQAWRVNCPFHGPITLSNCRHDAHTVLLCSNRQALDNQTRSRVFLRFRLKNITRIFVEKGRTATISMF